MFCCCLSKYKKIDLEDTVYPSLNTEGQKFTFDLLKTGDLILVRQPAVGKTPSKWIHAAVVVYAPNFTQRLPGLLLFEWLDQTKNPVSDEAGERTKITQFDTLNSEEAKDVVFGTAWSKSLLSEFNSRLDALLRTQSVTTTGTWVANEVFLVKLQSRDPVKEKARRVSTGVLDSEEFGQLKQALGKARVKSSNLLNTHLLESLIMIQSFLEECGVSKETYHSKEKLDSDCNRFTQLVSILDVDELHWEYTQPWKIKN